jgi:hypothetical protein
MLYINAHAHSFLTRDAALAILQKSGLDAAAVANVFQLADDDRDGTLSSKEFCVAFHLIICLT